MHLRSPLLTAIGGLAALAAAMGIGRFLYTPMLPLMSAATGMSAREAGLIASANFAGYLVGALLAALPGLSMHARAWMLGSLAVSAATTAGMAFEAPLWVWAALRFAGGIASAFVLVFASSLVMSHLARRSRTGLSPIHFAGVGTGILLSAIVSAPWILPEQAWSMGWIYGAGLTVLALGLAALLIAPPEAGSASGGGERRTATGLWRLVLAYGCLGFGYVITATFIVTILRDGGVGRTGEAIVWAMVGLSAIPSIALWSSISARIGGIRAYQLAMILEAVGVGVSVLSGWAAMLIAAVLLGGTFMGLTAMGFQEAVKRSAGDGRSIMALMTASFGTGQMIGPAVAGWLRDTTGNFILPSLIAACVLVFGAVVLLPLARARDVAR
ncbi:MAG: YbfB/YjiJ family MFS transporter [Pseudomonadota bacterium]